MTDHGELTTLSIERQAELAPPPPPLLPLSGGNKAGAFLDLLGRALIILAMPPLVLGAWSISPHYWKQSTRTRTVARVTHAEVYSGSYALGPHGQGPREKYYEYRCTVSFDVSGRPREAKLDLAAMVQSRDALDEWVTRFPEGSQIPILYKPSDPSRVQFDDDRDYHIVYHGALVLLNIAFWLLLGGIPLRLISKLVRMSESTVQDVQA
jgi:hypothetical protein